MLILPVAEFYLHFFKRVLYYVTLKTLILQNELNVL